MEHLNAAEMADLHVDPNTEQLHIILDIMEQILRRGSGVSCIAAVARLAQTSEAAERLLIELFTHLPLKDTAPFVR